MIRLGVVGANGKMGTQVVNLAINDKDFELVCAIDKFGAGKQLTNNVFVEENFEESLVKRKPDVVVDFTQPSVIYENIKTYIKLGIKSVIGTTGLSKEQVEDIEKMSKESNVGVIIAPNFSIGAILMMEFAARASKYFNNAEIIEYHHNQKKDAPSGTSIKTAQMMMKNNDNFKLGNCAEVETIPGARGGNYNEDGKGNIQIHAVRMPGFVASQQVILGADGQVLKIHHDTINRECYMSGVALAVKHIYNNNKFIYGLENII
ncbi:MAG: 4-hydroxy-tetrahydrodipicolinate reductase [Candidatus Gastranaerophilales bacterium]|nr:4-hydroxy-tetrahydrodipicolinate reductase [Candidatus Gastranaerophilales bacterium]